MRYKVVSKEIVALHSRNYLLLAISGCYLQSYLTVKIISPEWLFITVRNTLPGETLFDIGDAPSNTSMCECK